MEPPLSHNEATREQLERLAEFRKAVQKLRAEPFLAQTVLIDSLPAAGRIPPVEKPVWFLLEQYEGSIPVRTTSEENALCKAYRKAVHHYESYKQRIAYEATVRKTRQKAPTPTPVSFFSEIRNLFRGIRDVFTIWISILTFFLPTSFFVFISLLLIGLLLAIVYLF